MNRFRNAAVICFCTAVLSLIVAASATSRAFTQTVTSLGASIWLVGFGLTLCAAYARVRSRA